MIRQRGSSWQVDVVVDGKRVRKSVDSYAKARTLELHLTGKNTDRISSSNGRSNLCQGMPKIQKAGCTPTMNDMLELTWLRSWRHAKTGLELKRRAQSALVEMGWLDLGPEVITTRRFFHLTDFYLQKGNSCATINRKTVSITKLLGTAVDEGLIPFKPAVRLFPENNVRTRFVTRMEEEALLYWLRELNFDGAWHLTRFLVDTGCRFGEAMALRPQSINRKTNSVLFENTKNSMPRKIPLTERALESALKWGGLDYQQFYKQFVLARERAGLGVDVTPHTLRHTCASRLAQSGVSMAIIKAWLGHKSMRMTDRYTHLNDSSLRVARDALDEFDD